MIDKVSKVLCISLLAFAYLSKSQAQVRDLRIMPLGATMTYDLSNNDVEYSDEERPDNQKVSYRKNLEDNLINAGIQFQFVGSEISGNSQNFKNKNHAGFPYITVNQMNTLLKTGKMPSTYTSKNRYEPLRSAGEKITDGPYLDKYNPDYILIMLGMDDITNTNIERDISALIDTVENYKTRNDKMVTVLFGLLPSNAFETEKNTQLTALNQKITNAINRKIADTLVEYHIIKDINKISSSLDDRNLLPSGYQSISEHFFSKISDLELIQLCEDGKTTQLIEHFDFSNKRSKIDNTRLSCRICPSITEDITAIGKVAELSNGKFYRISPSSEKLNLDNRTSFSISIMMKTNQFFTEEISLLGLGKNTSIIRLFINRDGYICATIRDNKFNTVNLVSDNSKIINNNRWHQIVLIYDAEQKKTKLYLDAVLTIEVKTNLDGILRTAEEPFYIGRKNLDATDYFTGSIDELMIFSGALNESDIIYHYYKMVENKAFFCSNNYIFKLGENWATKIKVGQNFQLDASAFGPKATYRFLDKNSIPEGMTINKDNGLISWMPEAKDVEFRGLIKVQVSSATTGTRFSSAVFNLDIEQVVGEDNCNLEYQLSYNFDDVLTTVKPDAFIYIRDLLSHKMLVIDGSFTPGNSDSNNSDFPLGIGKTVNNKIENGHAIKSRNGLTYHLREANDRSLLFTRKKSFSISLFFKTDGNIELESEKYMALFAKNGIGTKITEPNDDKLIIGLDSQGKVFFKLTDEYAHSHTIVANKKYDDSKWHHLLVRRVSELKKNQLYVDGQMVGEINTNYLGDFFTNDDSGEEEDRFFIGSTGNNDDVFLGLIDNLDVYTRALSTSEIALLSSRINPENEFERCLFALEWLQGEDDLTVASQGTAYKEIIRVKGNPNPNFALDTKLENAKINPITGEFTWVVPGDYLGTESTKIQKIRIIATDPAATTEDKRVSRDFKITVGTYNNRPTLTYTKLITAFEDNGRTTGGYSYNEVISTDLSDGDMETQEIQISLDSSKSSNINLFDVSTGKPRITVTRQPTSERKGEARLSFHINSNVYGESLLHFIAQDNGSSGKNDFNTSQQILIRVIISPINDKPSFLLKKTGDLVSYPENIVTVNVNEGVSAYTVDEFAYNINDGDEELMQGLRFNITCNDNSAFESNPTINPDNGKLAFQFKENKVGVYNCTVNLTDNGAVGTVTTGKDYMHINQSDAMRFNFNVIEVNKAPELNIDKFKQAPTAKPSVQIKSVLGRRFELTIDGINDGDDGTQTLSFTDIIIEDQEQDKQNLLSFENPYKSQIEYDGGTTAKLILYPKNNPGNTKISFNLQDNGPKGGDNVFSTKYIIELNVLQGNKIPTFSVHENKNTITISEGDREYTAVWLTDTDDGDDDLNQKVEYRITNLSNSKIFEEDKKPKITINSAGDGVVTFKTKPNANGQANLNLALIDELNASSVVKRLTIIVTPINDPPTFNVGSILYVNKIGDEQSYPSFLKDINNGEDSYNPEQQVIGTIVQLDDSDKNNFDTLPTIDLSEDKQTGTLKFSLKDAVPKDTRIVIKITVKDNGANASPNVNTSISISVTLIVGEQVIDPSITPQPPLAIKKETQSTSLSVYPTSTQDIIYIEQDNLNLDNKTIFITNLNGQMIKIPFQPIGNNILHGNISKLKKGVYHLIMLDDNNKYFKKIIKQ